MKLFSKRIIAVILTIVMCASLCVTSFASENENDIKIAATGDAALLVCMLGHTDSLAVTGEEFDENVLAQWAYNADGKMKYEVIDGWTEGTSMSDTSFEYVLNDIQPDVFIEFDGDFSSIQIDAMANNNIECIKLNAMTSETEITDDITKLASMLDALFDDSTSTDIVNNYIVYCNGVKNSVASAVSGTDLKETLFIEDYDENFEVSYSFWNDNNKIAEFSFIGSPCIIVGSDNRALFDYMNYANVIDWSFAPHCSGSYYVDISNYKGKLCPLSTFSQHCTMYELGASNSGTSGVDASIPFFKLAGLIPLGCEDCVHTVIVKTSDIANLLKTDKLWETNDTTGTIIEEKRNHGSAESEHPVYGTIVNIDGNNAVTSIGGDYDILVNPSGIFNWSDGSPESILESLWLAYAVQGTMTAREFQNQVSNYYETVYGLKLTDEMFDGIISGDLSNIEYPEPCVYGEPSFVWNDDYTECTAQFACENHGEVIDVSCTVKSIVHDVTCIDDGYIEYTASCEFEDEAYTDTVNVITEPALNPEGGHQWGTPYYWDALYYRHSFLVICERCGEELRIPATLTEEEVEPTCTTPGGTANIATCEFEGVTYTDTFIFPVTADALGHAYGEPEFAWNDDFTECTAVFVCERCDDTVTVNCDISAEVTPATCTYSGYTTYTAICEFEDETHTDTDIEVTEPAMGHVFGDPVFNLDVNEHDPYDATATMTFTCEVCGEEFVIDCAVTVYADGDDYIYVITGEWGGVSYEDTQTLPVSYFDLANDTDTDTGSDTAGSDKSTDTASSSDTSSDTAPSIVTAPTDVSSVTSTGESTDDSVNTIAPYDDGGKDDGTETDGGKIQTGDVIAFIGAGAIVSGGICAIAYANKKKNKEEG